MTNMIRAFRNNKPFSGQTRLRWHGLDPSNTGETIKFDPGGVTINALKGLSNAKTEQSGL